MKKRLTWVWIVVLVGLFGLNYIMEIGNFTLKQGVDYDAFKLGIDQTIPNLMQKYQIPGAAIAVVRGGKVDLVKGYGWADKKAKRPVDGETLFQVASNSKTVTAWGVMKLVEAGKLDLDAPVEQYLTRWKLPKSKYDTRQVTLRRILSHTAGLSQKSYAGYPPDAQLPTLEQSLSGQAKGTRELRVAKEPGKKYRYSGGGYTLAQLVIEEVTGRPFEEFMAEEVLKPLGMESSSFEWQDGLREKTAKAYGVLGQELPNYLFTEKAAAGLYTSASDLARFVAANLNGIAGGSLIGAKSLALMYTPVDEDENYGLGYLIKELPDHTLLIYHGGTNRGWRAQFALLPERRDGLVVLTNSEYGESLHRDLVSIWTQWETGYWPDFYLKNNILRSLVKTIALMLILWVLWKLGSTVREVREGKRRFIFSKKAPAGTGFGVVAGMLLPVVFLAFWGMLFYTGLIYNGWAFASFVPAGFTRVTVAVVFGSIFFLIRGFFVKAEPGAVSKGMADQKI